MYYVYKFLNKEEEVIYVGYTNNMSSRLSNHFTNGHLDKSVYESVSRILYSSFKNSVTAKYIESELIGLLKPIFNKDYIELEHTYGTESIINNLEWKEYKRKKKRKPKGVSYNKEYRDVFNDWNEGEKIVCHELELSKKVNMFGVKNTNSVIFLFMVINHLKNIVDREKIEYTEYRIRYIGDGLKVFKPLYRVHKKEFMLMLEDGLELKIDDKVVFKSKSINNSVYVYVHKSLFTGKDLFKNILLSDIIDIKKKASLYIYLYAVDSETGNFWIDLKDFSEFCKCGKRYTQFLKDSLPKLKYTSCETTITHDKIIFDMELIRGENKLIYMDYKNKTKTITGTW